jgi:hypothetical protein
MIDGQAYHLPSPKLGIFKVMLGDGSIAQLHSDKVVVRGQELAIPAGLSSVREISAGGQTIKAQPGPATQPQNGNGGGGGGGGCVGGGGGGDKGKGKGGGGIGGLFKGLVGAAGAAVGGLADAGKGAVDFATGAGGAAAGDLAGTVSGALGNVDGVVSALNDIQQDFSLDSLTGPELDAFNGVQNTGRGAANLLTSAKDMLGGFDGLTPDLQQTAKDNMKEFAGEGGELEKARQAFETFEQFP